jgi:hypothetical protein
MVEMSTAHLGGEHLVGRGNRERRVVDRLVGHRQSPDGVEQCHLEGVEIVGAAVRVHDPTLIPRRFRPPIASNAPIAGKTGVIFLVSQDMFS